MGYIDLPFRILIETYGGTSLSFCGVNGNGEIRVDDANSGLETVAKLEDQINSMQTCNYLDNPNDVWGQLGTPGGYTNQFQDTPPNSYLNVDYDGDFLRFTHDVANDTADRLKRYKFFGSHVCNVIGYPENMWIYPETFRFDASGNNAHSIRSDVSANKLYVNDSMQFTDYSRITSNMQFQVDSVSTNKSDSLIIWRESGSVVIPLVMGYDAENNKMIVSSSATSEASFGSITTAGNITIGGEVRSTGDVIAYHSSDERLKDNIRLIDNPVEKVSKLRGVQFEWNDSQNTYVCGSADTGIIAQDVQKVLPELVKERSDGYLGIRYEKLAGLLVEGIKEQQQQIDELKEQNKIFIEEIKKIRGEK